MKPVYQKTKGNPKRNRKIAILGFGREGKSLLKFLQNTQIYADGHADKRGYKNISANLHSNQRESASGEIWVLDENPGSVSSVKRHASAQAPADAKALADKSTGRQVSGIRTGKNYLKNLKDFDIIFRSPGIPYLSPEIQKAKKAGVEISSPTKLFFDLVRGTTQTTHGQKQKLVGVSPRSVSVSQRPMIIGVTGTKGKGTTSTLLYKILQAAHKKVFLAGNIGTPALDILSKTQTNADNTQTNAEKIPCSSASSPRQSASIVILELSSFQLIDMEKSPHIAVALMVTSEHLDWHTDVKEYVSAKANIVRFQSPNDYAVIAEDYPRSMSYARKTKARVLTFSQNMEVKKGTWVERGYFWFRSGKKKEKVCATRELQIPGKHNWENAGAAITVAKILGVKNAAIAKVIRNFNGLEHRLEFVAKRNGVKYYNDSYATTPETAEVAIAAFSAPKVLILGGSRKGSDFSRLGRILSRSKTVKAIIGVGKEWPRIKRHIKNPGIRMIEGCKNMKEVVQKAHAAATSGDVVLLSPACASFDMFRNYTERGRQFKKFVKQLQ